MRALFVDVRNAAGSQIAQALVERDGGEARSAGTNVAAEIDEAAIEALEEIGVDISARTPRPLVDGDLAWADLVVRLAEDWSLADPVGLCLEEARELRAVIEEKLSSLPR